MFDGNGMSLAISTLGDGARSELGQDRMRPRYKVSQAGVDLIEAFEGLRAKAARLDDGRWTIGYGHTRSAREGAEVSREDALILLRWVDLPPVEEAINALVSVPLTQNQYDALVAFVFNVGVDAFGDSEVLEHLNQGRLTEAACSLELWRKADIAGDPVVLDALIRRRAAEKALFLAPGEGGAPSPSPLVRPRPDARAAQFVPARRPAEIEASLAGDRAEVRLVVPYEVEPEPEAATPLRPEAGEPAAEAAPIPESALEEEAPTAWTTEAAEPQAEAALIALAAWSDEIVEVAEITLQPETAVAPETAPTAWVVETPEQPVHETAEAAPSASLAGAVDEAGREPAPTVLTAETPDASAEEAPHEAATAWTPEVVEQAAQEFEPPAAWSIELAHAAALVLQEPAPTAWTAEPAETGWDEPAPSSWIVGATSPAAPASEPAPAAAESAAAPAAEAAAEAEGAAVSEPAPETAPVEAPEPEAVVRELPAVGSVLQTRALPQTAPRPRPLYSSYGPMAFAVAPPPTPTVAETTPAPAGEGAGTAAPSPEPVQPQSVAPQHALPQSFQPQPAQGPSFHRQAHFQPLPELTVPAAAVRPAQPVQSFAPPVPAASQASATASAPAVTADAAPARPLILTSPPADWEEPRAAPTHASLAAEADELETPLFDEGWDGPGALSGRIVHHEAPAEHDARATKLGVTGPYVLLGFIGFVAFGGALFAFSRGHAGAGGANNPVVLAWILALIGAACVGISVYFLLKRLGGQED